MATDKSSSYPEIENIREDLNSLRSNVVELTKHLQADGNTQALELRKRARKRWEGLREDGRRRYGKVEARVKEHPGQSVALAFATGMFASYLLSRR